MNTKNTSIVVDGSVDGSRKPTTIRLPDPARSDAAKRAWKTAENRAVAEATEERRVADRRDVVAIVQRFTSTLPEEAMIDSVLSNLAKAKMSPTQLHAELEKRAEKLAEPMRSPFVLFIAQQFASGKAKLAAPVLKPREREPERLVVGCNFCSLEYGTGTSPVDADGEILPAVVWDARRMSGDDHYDVNGYVDCPVCVTPKAIPEPTKGFDIGGAALRKL